MLLYAITQRSLLPGDETARTELLLQQAQTLARGGVHFLQIREKDLALPSLHALARSLVSIVEAESSPMKILLNGPPEVALHTGCHGIHLASSTPLSEATAARDLYRRAGRPCFLSAACHDTHEIEERRHHADLLLFAPVFEKILPGQVIPGTGLSALSQAVSQAQNTPIVALGGITAQNAHACIAAGARGIAAIRLFLTGEWRALTNQSQEEPQQNPQDEA